MNQPGRPIDRAMGQGRAEKHTVRMFWLEEARDYINRYPEDEEPLYLTLSGAEGHDVRLFAEYGLINLTETGAIATKDQGKIVAVEANDQAVLQLYRQFSGLKIVQKNFQSLVRGTEYFSWPEGKEKHYCRARIVNLDLNSALRAKKEERIDFPVIAWIDKVAKLHTRPSPRDWSLCLTLQGEINWNDEVCSFAQEFLCDNFRSEPSFAESCRKLFGETLYQNINNSEVSVDFSTLLSEAQQQVLMVTVPKLIAQRVRNQGWRMVTKRNLRYGGGATASMITWIMRFTWDTRAVSAPNIAHRDALTGIFHFVGSIRDDGQIEEDE